jgi:glutamate-1-semialdehyde 2,1-aminomutase
MKKNFNKIITKKLNNVIPGGAHTYSKAADQFPYNAPCILNKGQGAYVYDNKNNKILDYGMGLRSVNVGYAEKYINEAAIDALRKGNNLSRPSEIELKAALTFVKLIESADMVKFAKNGSSSVTGAIKLARAFTGKEVVLRCNQHPFFSYDDWFIGSTVIKKGIPKSSIKLTDGFDYNNIDSLKKKIIDYKNNVACVILEPATSDCPSINGLAGCCGKQRCTRNYKNNKNFLHEVQEICRENKIVFILDEMITGFRWHLKGAQYLYNIKPDLSTFGKAMANGFSVSAVGGKREIMSLGSINKKGKERVFLLSSTHGAEMTSLSAFIANIEFMKKNEVIKKNWAYGAKLIQEINKISYACGVGDYFFLNGPACSPVVNSLNKEKNIDLGFKTLFMQEMMKSNILIPYISICYRHNSETMGITLRAVKKSLQIYEQALKFGIEKYLKCEPVKPVFRKYN